MFWNPYPSPWYIGTQLVQGRVSVEPAGAQSASAPVADT